MDSLCTISMTFFVNLKIIQLKAFLFYFFRKLREFPGGPVIRDLCFHCKGHGFNSWLGD